MPNPYELNLRNAKGRVKSAMYDKMISDLEAVITLDDVQNLISVYKKERAEETAKTLAEEF